MPLIIDNDNELFDANFQRGHQAAPEGHSTNGYSSSFASHFQLIPRSEWRERIKTQRLLNGAIDQRINWASVNQGKFPTCWAAGVCAAFTAARAFQGLSIVRPSTMSIAVPISGGHRGGFVGEAVEYFIRHGAALENDWLADNPRLQRGPKIDAAREALRITSALELSSFDELATAALLGIPCAVWSDRWGHAFMSCSLLEVESDHFALRCRNNWGESWGDKNQNGFGGFLDLSEHSRTRVDGGFALWQVKPAKVAT